MATTQTALADLLAQDLAELNLVALMIDGVHFAHLPEMICGPAAKRIRKACLADSALTAEARPAWWRRPSSSAA